MIFSRQSLNIPVKDVLDDTLGDCSAEWVTIREDGDCNLLGEANDYQSALVVFEKFLNLRVTDYFWGSKNGKTGVDIIVDEDDYYKLRHGEKNGIR